jgi:hypothetical protein
MLSSHFTREEKKSGINSIGCVCADFLNYSVDAMTFSTSGLYINFLSIL